MSKNKPEYQLSIEDNVLYAKHNKDKKNHEIVSIKRFDDSNVVSEEWNRKKNSEQSIDDKICSMNVNPGEYYSVRVKRENAKAKTYYIEIVDSNGKIVVKQRSSKRRDKSCSDSGSVDAFEDIFFRNNLYVIEDKRLIKIIDFFLLRCPHDIPEKATTVKHYDIKKRWGKSCWGNSRKSLRNILLNTIENPSTSLEEVDSGHDMRRGIELLGLEKYEDFREKELMCFINGEENTFLSIFRHIRNSLAHGRFVNYSENNNEYIFFEDKLPGRNAISARINLKVDTLITWIEIIKKGPIEKK